MFVSKSVVSGVAFVFALGSLVVAPALLTAQPYAADVTFGNKTDSPSSSHDCNDPANPVTNCGFESGDFTGWVTTDLSAPFYPLSVDPAGVNVGFGFFSSAPTEGAFSANNGFDGDGPGTIIIAQDVTLPGGAQVEFDYRGAWDMTFGATQDRTFVVEVEPAGGGAAMQSYAILTATAGSTVVDTGPLSVILDLSAFGGQTVRLSFEWFVPEVNTGPAFFQIDNVLITAGVPTMPILGLVGLVSALLLISLFLLKRRRRET